MVGVLSGMFGKPEPESGSMVLQWAEKKRKELLLQHENKMTLEVMFVGFIDAVSTFAKPSPSQFPNLEPFDMILGSQADWANDSALFELGCYVYFRVEVWLFANRPHLREQVARYFLRNFIALFVHALQITNDDDFADLVYERIGKYGELIRSGAETEEYEYHLFYLIYRTRENRKPQHYGFESGHFSPGNPASWASLNPNLATKLWTWEANMLPAILKSIEFATDTLQRQSTDKDIT